MATHSVSVYFHFCPKSHWHLCVTWMLIDSKIVYPGCNWKMCLRKMNPLMFVYTQRVCKQKMWHVIKQENLVISFATTSHKLFWQTNKLYEAAVEKKKREKTQALNLTAIQRGKRKRKHQSWGLLFQLPWKHPSKPNISMSPLLIIIWFDCTSLKL